MQQDEVSTPRQLLTIKQFSLRFPAWSAASLRALVYASKDRTASGGRVIVKGNGLEACGAIIRLSRRILIDEEAWFRWLAAQQKQRRGAKAAA